MTVEQSSTDERKAAAKLRRRLRWCVPRWRSILLTALVIAALGFTGGMFFFRYHPDQQVADVAVGQVVQTASDGSVALLSYSYESLDRDFAKAQSYLTGDLLAYYDKFSEQTVAPTAQQRQVKTSARVTRAAVSEIHRDSAVVLVFLVQTTVSKDKPEPAIAPSTVLATMVKVGGSYKIAKFDRIS